MNPLRSSVGGVNHRRNQSYAVIIAVCNIRNRTGTWEALSWCGSMFLPGITWIGLLVLFQLRAGSGVGLRQ